MIIATIPYNPVTLLEVQYAKGEQRELKRGNYQNAITKIFSHGPEHHTPELYRDGTVKDGWHHLHALATLIKEGTLAPDYKIECNIID